MEKPILKWVGGKTKILDNLFEKFPKKMINYHESFIGGGSVLIELLKRVNSNDIIIQDKIYASDINEGLIGLYINIQKNPILLYEEILYHIEEYSHCSDEKTGIRNASTIEEALKCKEDYYYWIRNQYNKLQDKMSIKASALFLFLNKTCFRGLFREGPNGFNVPFGNYKNLEIIKKDYLIRLSKLLEPVEFRCCSYLDALKKVDINDFIYMDPPYVEEKKGSFVTYTADGFDHELFFETIKNIKGMFVLSNSNTDYVREKMKSYKMEEIKCRRAIHSKNPASSTIELIVQNNYSNNN